MSVPFGREPGGWGPSALQGKRIIVAETEAVTIILLQFALKRAGARIVALCHSARESIAVAAQQMPDLILMDLPPEGDEDHATAEVVRQLSKGKMGCIVLMAASVSEQKVQQLREAGAAAVILKPFTIDTLLSLLEETYHFRCTLAT